MTEIRYVVESNQTWTCVKCGAEVPSEEMGGWTDAKGQPTTLYAPASRYWLPGSKPGLTAGVFCGPKCAFYHYGGEVGPSGVEGKSGPICCAGSAAPHANNENPEGL